MRGNDLEIEMRAIKSIKEKGEAQQGIYMQDARDGAQPKWRVAC